MAYKDWESFVKKQLKTDNISAELSKENLEGISVHPYYADTFCKLNNLPKVSESTHLVSPYREVLEDEVFAFLVSESPEVADKAIFVSSGFIENNFNFLPDNRYFSLVDIFNDVGLKEENHLYSLHASFGGRLLIMPFERSICIDVAAHQNSGASIIQQLAFALAKTKELTEVFGAEILDKLVIKIAVGGNYFFEIAKLRALKLLFNQLSKEFNLNHFPFIFAETSLRNKALHDAENNLIRSTLELSAAMIGGADAVFSNNFKVGAADDLSAEISFKQQIVLAYESIINVFDDAGNGSYYIENITQQLCEKAWQKFLEIEAAGGYLKLLNDGTVQKEIYDQALAEQKWVEEGRIKLIGVNLYPKLEKTRTAAELYSADQIKPVRWAEMFE